MTVDRKALFRAFLDETEEQLAILEEQLLALEGNPRAPGAVAEIFRLVHTLKGNAGIFGFSSVATLAHALEDYLEQVRAGRLELTSEGVDLLLEAADGLRRLLEGIAAGDEDRKVGRALLDTLESAADPGRRGGSSRKGSETDASNGDASTGMEPAGHPGSPLSTSGPSRRETTLRVEVEKLDRLVDVAGEIGISRGRVVQLLEDPTVSKEVVLQALREADYLHLELQELVMELRMVPIGPSLRRHVRMVRDMAAALGKQARLVLEGEEVELDMSVIEHLRDPLTHMIRNALDHGIETPEERKAAGKDPVGRVEVRTLTDAGSIVIEVRDDGRGLDRERILTRARTVGRVGENENPGDPRLDALVFEEGFSTADSVTDVSGRGVGMDVVRRNIEALRGSVRVSSQPGQGTTFSIRMPLTLAVIEGFLVGVGRETYILPLDSVAETVGLPRELRLGSDGTAVLPRRGKTVGCVRLRRLLGANGAPEGRESVVIVNRGRRHLGLVVDELLGEQQTVIKPVPKLLRELPGVSGSAILGDGRVAFILDVADLLGHLPQAFEASVAGGRFRLPNIVCQPSCAIEG